ncbi:hypothetical protein Lal_00039962 [Lupinus albus]|nr:hypothetical protein Lal_00039962 [Lupinus albus]
MDAFDTQIQQIHYELHHLSSRLSNMDVDEDSSEPDQKGEKSWEAHNSKRKGEHTCIHIGGAYSSQDISSSMMLSENYTFKKTLVCHHQKGGDCDEDLAPDLVMVLMKTPISQKEERKKTYKDYRRQSFEDLESKNLLRVKSTGRRTRRGREESFFKDKKLGYSSKSLRRDPKVGGDVGGTCGVTRNKTQHSPSIHQLDLYVIILRMIGKFRQKSTNPNPPEFHSQSSSSAAMPSKQTLMDVLVSLRDYITNRMDALDT